MATNTHEDTYQDFGEAVNMTASEIRDWLETDASKAVGQKSSDGAESVGHRSGRRIIEILHTKKNDLSDADFDHMQKVVGYVHRHLAQRPSGDVNDTDWAHSLKNWGHDPGKTS